ncbi:MAG: gliding motility-associated C-terminal domain-containing protein [Owenweeksia sp.]|nr:gliding motility-associated C-terminal domain-containing protein [Owenweeksia sp.]
MVNSGKAQVNLGPDTTVCASDFYTLRTGVRGAVHLWHNGTTGGSFTVTKAGTYWVGVDNGCGYSYDTIHISVISKPKLNLSDTIYYCKNQSTIMDASSYSGVTGFAWDNGQTSNIRSFSSPGAHWLKVWNSCDTVTENFYVQSFESQSFSLGPDTILCEKDWELDPQLTAYGNDYMWGNGSTASSITVNSTGTYWVEIQNACDTLRDTINLIFLNDLKPISKAAVRICAGDTAELGPPPQSQVSYQWSTGDTSRTTFHSQGGWYHLMAYNQCDTLWDSVRVIVDQPINLNLGPDTTFCQPGVHFINVTRYNADSIYWSTGSRNAGLPINKSGTYWVNLYNACGMYSDTINVSVDLLPKRKLSNRAFCLGAIDTLDVSQSIVQSYQWNTGATTSSIQVSQTGWYKVEMTNNCGTVRDSAYVRVDNPIPQFSLGADTIFCQGSLLLNPALKEFANYQWQDGSANTTFTVYQSGQYYLTASNTCNTRSDTINVLITGPPVLVLGDEVRLCNGTLLTLNAQNPGSSYLWSTGDTTQQFTTDSSGTYWVTITNDCGQLTDTVDVFVDFPMMDLNLGADTIICRGQALTLQTQYPSAKTLWNTGATSTSITVNKTGQYWVEVSNTCGKWLDSIFVKVEDIPVFSLGNDSTICAFDGSFPINGPPGMLHYRWSNGDSTQGTVLTDAGEHWLKVSNRCFSYTDTIFLREEFPIPLELGPDTIICFGESLELDPGNLGYPITWKGGRRQQSIEVTRSGTYWASARNSCGVFDDTIVVRVDHYLDDSPIDTLICRGDSAVLDISNRHYDVRWADGSTDSVRWFAEAGTYMLTLFNRCGAFPKDFIVKQQLCDCPLFIPNAFTPNDDKLNDSFEIAHKCDISRFELQIFNRWGEMVFSSDSPERSWDGNFNGRPAPMGAYHYSLVYAWKVYGVERTRESRGRINLIR